LSRFGLVLYTADVTSTRTYNSVTKVHFHEERTATEGGPYSAWLVIR
jgi:hypothetical protein